MAVERQSVILDIVFRTAITANPALAALKINEPLLQFCVSFKMSIFVPVAQPDRASV